MVHNSYGKLFDYKTRDILKYLDKEDYLPGLDLELMYKTMHYTAEGYMWEMVQKGKINPHKMEKDSYKMLNFWREIYENPQKRRRRNEGN